MPSNEKPTDLVKLREAREQAIAQLSDAFAHDVIGVEEFEGRLTLAHRASAVADIAQLVSDLAAAVPTQALVPAVAQRPVRAGAPESDSVVAIFGGVERRGAWTLPQRLRVRAVMGGIVLDFREALLSPGPTEIHVTAMMGGVQILVPPGLSVEVSGTAIMGGFGHVERAPLQLDPDSPFLRVRGLAILGGVAVETRLPGESEAEAHRRRGRDGRTLVGRDERRRLPR
jgi:hypothetical protein